ncbi:MAG: AI-2E family transporter, partial [Oxalobacteraceae bacterium]
MQLAQSDPAMPATPPDTAAPGALPPSSNGDALHPEVRSTGDDLALHIGALRVPLHVNARGLALGVLATIAFVFALQWAQKFFVPLLLGILIAYTLNPVVRWLERWHIRRIVGATLVTVVIVGAMAGT